MRYVSLHGNQVLRHLVIIRFNAGNPDPDFFDYRMDLFSRICLPSLIAQDINLDQVTFFFRCDSRTPGSRLINLKTLLVKSLPYFNVCFGPIQSHVGILKDEQVITTRIDNDDAIAPTFLKDIETNLLESDHGFACFKHGAYWDLCGKRFRLVTSKKPNQFLSMISRGDHAGRFESVYDIKHGEAKPCHFIDSIGPKWVWVLHSRDAGQQMSNKTGKGISPYLDDNHEDWMDEDLMFPFFPCLKGFRA